MAHLQTTGSIASVTPTVSRLFGIPEPAISSEPPLAPVIEHADTVLGTAPIERCLVFCPDALGKKIWERCPDETDLITARAPIGVLLSSVFPPKTPVCFASIFTGGQPDQHGIRRYERPVLRCDTLFDALIRGDKKAAIVAVRESSIDLIFRGRNIDYYSEAYDREVTERTVQVIEKNRHHLIVSYQQEYDDLLHKTEPFSNACVQAVSRHVQSFVALAAAVSKAWTCCNHAIVFAPDHGAHLDSNTGRGDHGEDIAEDMLVYHWYGIVSNNDDAARACQGFPGPGWK